jgi:hypothetical protein
MYHKSLLIFFAVFFHLFLITGNLIAQEWEFIKERDSIKIYTRSEENNPVKSYRAEADVRTNMASISSVIGSIESFEWWEENLREIKVLAYEKEKYIRYYLIYDVQWPISDRDLCVEAIITNDPVTGKRTVRATPIEGLIPEKPDLVRIKNYWQQWTMEPIGNGMLHLTLEGSVDPGGNIPSWLINMVITETPLKIMRKVIEQVQI